MKLIISYISLLLGFVSILQGQTAMDTIQLPEVRLIETRLIAHSIGTQMDIIRTEAQGEGSSCNLASIISSSSSLYIKQYGALATPSFRGTSSSHTLVLWNGVPLNSIANGLSDFSSINTHNFTDISLVYGGNASVFGSGAIGGSIHLNTNIKSLHKNAFSVSTTIGSYGLKSESLAFYINHGKLTAKASIQFLNNDNNFEYINTTKIGRPLSVNEYGSIISKNQQLDLFYNLNANTNYIFSFWLSELDREVPQNMTTPFSDAKQYDNAQRSLLTLNHKIDNLNITLKQAYIQEDFRYTEILKYMDSHYLAESYISDADFKLERGNYLINFAGAYTNNKIVNNNYISRVRQEESLTVFSALQYSSGFAAFNTVLRKEWQTTFEVPFIPFLAFEAKLSSAIKFRIKYNRNFRSPSFNDRFWSGSGSNGNSDLTPEDAWNKEIGFDFNSKYFHFSSTAYTLNILDMILWQRKDNGNWMPNNISQVWSRGAEVKLKFKTKNLSIDGNYAYTKSTNELPNNKLDNTVGKQLRYVPFHKGNVSFTITEDNLQFKLNKSYTGEVITTYGSLKNNIIDGFFLTDVSVIYNLDKLPFTIFAKVRNFMNRTYTTYQNYPNPGRELLLTINYTIN